MKLKTKSQTTPFVIMGIVIFFIIVSLAYIVGYILKPDQELAFNENSIQLYIDTCIEQEAKEAINNISANAGFKTITYNQIADKTTFENNIAKKINNSLLSCLNNFEEFPWDINYNLKQTNVNINLKDIKINLQFPITITKDNDKINIDEFITLIESNLFEQIDIANNILENEWIDTTFLNEQEKFNFNMTVQNNELTINIEDKLNTLTIKRK